MKLNVFWTLSCFSKVLVSTFWTASHPSLIVLLASVFSPPNIRIFLVAFLVSRLLHRTRSFSFSIASAIQSVIIAEAQTVHSHVPVPSAGKRQPVKPKPMVQHSERTDSDVLEMVVLDLSVGNGEALKRRSSISLSSCTLAQVQQPTRQLQRPRPGQPTASLLTLTLGATPRHSLLSKHDYQRFSRDLSL